MAAEAVISVAVESLGKLLIQKAAFLHGVKGQVKWLKDELQSMQCFLRDAAEKQGDERIRKWVSDIRDVAHDAEDAIETFVFKVEKERRSRGKMGRCACFPVHLNHLNSVGKEIESIRERLRDIRQRRQTYGILDLGHRISRVLSTRSEDVERRRRLSPWGEDKHLVGLDEDVERLLLESILKEHRGLSIAAIVGMGGIGKSTLARKIYNNPAVAAAQFDVRVWVVVSNDFTPEDIFRQILLQLHISEDDRRGLKDVEFIKDKLRREEILQNILRKHLVGKRYFVVLDDVWEQKHWESLINAFPDEQDTTSRLLFTSRNLQIITMNEGYVCKMRLLNSDESWELLLKTAFIGNEKCPEELESIGKEILRKCDGLPLAIKVAGGLLVNEGESKSGWEKVLKQIRDYQSETSEVNNNVSAILELSFQNLPPQLKVCFLCLGFFKEDATIEAKRLVHIWVAQGFINSEKVGGEETTEEIAMSYLNELINRNLIQVMDMSIDGQVKRCHVHDLLRDLSIKKAEEEIGLQILKEEGNSSNSSYKPHHRVVHCSGEGLMIDSLNENKYLRSLILHVEGCDEFSVGSSSYWKSYELLRLLDIGGAAFKKFPNAFCALTRLRYLRLKTNYFWYLPKWLDRLQNLEVLYIDGNGDIYLPNGKWKIDSLRQFYARRIYGPMDIDGWKNLETLKYISSGNLTGDDPPKKMASCRIRKVGLIVVDWSSADDLWKSIEMMKNLVQLHLEWDDYVASPVIAIPLVDNLTKLKLDGYITQLPAVFPPNLSRLTLCGRELIRYGRRAGEDPMPILGKLPKLLSLKLKHVYWGGEMRVLNDGFPRLQFLSLQWMADLRFMHIEEGGMPQLQRFEIFDCRNLNTDNLREHLRSDAIIIIDN